MSEINTPGVKNEWPGSFFGVPGKDFGPDVFEAKAYVIKIRFRMVQILMLMYLVMDFAFRFRAGKIRIEDVGRVQFPFIEFSVLFLVLMAFEVLYRFFQNYNLVRRQYEPIWIKMVVITVEVSMPVFGILGEWIHAPLAECERVNFFINHIPFMVLSMLYLNFWLCFYAGMVALVERAVLLTLVHWGGDIEFQVGSLWSLWHLFLTGLMLGTIAYLMRRMVEMVLKSRAERMRVQDIFGRFVSRDVARQLVERPISLGGELCQACVMFLDIRNFTHRSSLLTSEQTVEYLNNLFAFTVAEVEKAGGIVNKFLGDGFMAIFGAPLPLANPSCAAMDCAVGIFLKLRDFNASRGADPVEIGIGIHFGPMVSGVVGTPERKEFTVIGDTVNMASRIEGLNKDLGSKLLVSHSVYENLTRAFQGAFEPVPNVRVKGKDDPFTVYRYRKS